MIYLRARYYDPSVGRFISEDKYKGQVDKPLTLKGEGIITAFPFK